MLHAIGCLPCLAAAKIAAPFAKLFFLLIGEDRIAPLHVKYIVRLSSNL
jgi:hypothetical protein